MSDVEDNEEELQLPNKKNELLIIDGGKHMFEGGRDCGFRRALKAVANRVIAEGATGRSNTEMGVAIAGAKCASKSRSLLSEWFKIGPVTPAMAQQMLTMHDEDDLESDFASRFGGSLKCDWREVIPAARTLLTKVGPNDRFRKITIYTGDTAPFEGEKERESLQQLVNDFMKPGKNVNRQLCVQSVYTEEEKEEVLEAWEKFIPHGTAIAFEEELVTSINYPQQEFPRASTRVELSIGPLVLECGVYVLSSEVSLPRIRKVDPDDEKTKITQKTLFVTEEEEGGEKVELTRGETVHRVRIGGESVQLGGDDGHDHILPFEKGIVMLGTRPLSTLKREDYLKPSRYLQPKTDAIANSTRAYRALCDSLRKDGRYALCRWVSRSNERPSLVALVPGEGKYSGLHAVFLPFREDVIDVSEQLRSVGGAGAGDEEMEQEEEVPKVAAPAKEQVSTAAAFLRTMKKKELPEFHNQRLLNALEVVTELAVGSSSGEWEKKDNMVRDDSDSAAAALQSFLDTVEVTMDAEKGKKRAAPAVAAENGAAAPKRGRGSALELSQMSLAQLAQQGRKTVESLTVAVLREKLSLAGLPTGGKKADLVDNVMNNFQ